MQGETAMPAKVTMGGPGQIEAIKPMDEMSEQEKADLKAEVVARLAAQAAQGNKAILEIRIAKYLQGAVGVDSATENLAVYFAVMDVCVIWETAPSWFKPREMYDVAILSHILARWTNWRNSFPKFVPAESQGNSEAP
jgi:hypothetical protein